MQESGQLCRKKSGWPKGAGSRLVDDDEYRFITTMWGGELQDLQWKTMAWATDGGEGPVMKALRSLPQRNLEGCTRRNGCEKLSRIRIERMN